MPIDGIAGCGSGISTGMQHVRILNLGSVAPFISNIPLGQFIFVFSTPFSYLIVFFPALGEWDWVVTICSTEIRFPKFQIATYCLLLGLRYRDTALTSSVCHVGSYG